MCLAGNSASPPTPDPTFRNLLSGNSSPRATQDPTYRVFKLLPGEGPSGFFPDFPPRLISGVRHITREHFAQ